MSILNNIYQNFAYIWKKDPNDVYNVLHSISLTLQHINERISNMSLDLTKLVEEVAHVEEVNASAVLLIEKLLTEIELHKDDPAALDALVGRVRVATDALAAAVAAVPGDPVPELPVEEPVVVEPVVEEPVVE